MNIYIKEYYYSRLVPSLAETYRQLEVELTLNGDKDNDKIKFLRDTADFWKNISASIISSSLNKVSYVYDVEDLVEIFKIKVTDRVSDLSKFSGHYNYNGGMLAYHDSDDGEIYAIPIIPGLNDYLREKNCKVDANLQVPFSHNEEPEDYTARAVLDIAKTTAGILNEKFSTYNKPNEPAEKN